MACNSWARASDLAFALQALSKRNRDRSGYGLPGELREITGQLAGFLVVYVETHCVHLGKVATINTLHR